MLLKLYTHTSTDSGKGLWITNDEVKDIRIHGYRQSQCSTINHGCKCLASTIRKKWRKKVVAATNEEGERPLVLDVNALNSENWQTYLTWTGEAKEKLKQQKKKKKTKKIETSREQSPGCLLFVLSFISSTFCYVFISN